MGSKVPPKMATRNEGSSPSALRMGRTLRCTTLAPTRIEPSCVLVGVTELVIVDVDVDVDVEVEVEVEVDVVVESEMELEMELEMEAGLGDTGDVGDVGEVGDVG